MALTIEPDDVPPIPFLVFEDEDGDRWMAPGVIRVRDSSGILTEYPVPGSGEAFHIGTGTGELFFRLDLDEDGISTGVTGPTIDAAVPLDVLPDLGVDGEYFWHVATINSTTVGDFSQHIDGAVTWNNGPAGLPSDAVSVVFKNGAGIEIGRLSFSGGRFLGATSIDISTSDETTGGSGP